VRQRRGQEPALQGFGNLAALALGPLQATDYAPRTGDPDREQAGENHCGDREDVYRDEFDWPRSFLLPRPAY
jgi:hypothetical protein